MMRYVLFLLGVLTFLPATALAQDAKTPLIPRSVLFGNPDKAGAKISPDGKYLSWLAPRDGVMNVYVAPIGDLTKARPVTADKKRGIRMYFWTFAGNYLLYAQDVGGNEDFHIYRVDLTTDKTDDLTPFPKVRANISGVSPHHPKEILVGLNDRDPRFHDVYRINLETGTKELLQKNEGFSGFLIDDHYKVRFAMKFSLDGGNLVMQPDGKDGWKEFTKIPMADTLTTNPVGFDKSGEVLYLVDSRGRDTGALTTLDLKSGKQTTLAQDPRTDCGSVMLHPTEHTLQAVAFTYERTKWQFFDPKVKADFEVLAKVADGEVTITSRTRDDQTWIVAFLMDNGPVRYYRYDRGTQKADFLFTNRQSLEGLPLRKMQPQVVKSRDGMNLVCYLTTPNDETPPSPPSTGGAKGGLGLKPMPMVLLVHGGPWGRDDWGFNPIHQFLANRGYAVLSVNFRGSTGLGKKFLNAGNQEWAGKMHDDLIDAVNWAVEKKIADPSKVAIMGGSYGGYATLVGLTFTPDVFACGVDIVGPSNILTLLSTIPAYWAPAVQMFKDRVGDYTSEEGKKFLLERSPLTHVQKIKRPLLIAQGANDPRVKQAESDQIVKAMGERNIPVTYVLFPDEGHGFNRPANSLAFNAVTEAFLAKHLGGRYEPIGDAFTGSTITVPTGADGVPGLAGKLPKKEGK